MATKAEKEHLIEVLKFTPRTYKLRLWGYGGELVLGEIDKKVWDYFRKHKIDVSDYACDSDFGEGLEVPEDCQPFYPGQWHDCDSMYHGWGVSRNAGTLEVEDENGEVVYTRQLEDLDGCDVQLSCGEEAFIEMKGPGSCVFYNYSSEKGTFFEGDIELTSPFNPEKLCIKYDDIDSEELITSVSYNGDDLDNYGGDTTGKGYDFSFYHVDDVGELHQYRNGSDVDEDYDDGTPPSGPSPNDWEKTPKMIGVNPVYSGWYSCNYARGSTWGSLYWNNEKNMWEDYYHGRVTHTYSTVDYWIGYNWDTSNWANRPPEPPDVICKSKGCGYIGDSEKIERNDDYDLVCPDCGKTKFDWIEYDPDTAKGRKNREKYCVSALDAALNKLAEEIPGFPTAADIEALEKDIEELATWPFGLAETKEEPMSKETVSKYWTVKTYYKKNVEQRESFVQRDGDGRMTIVDGFRWGEWTVETNDGEFPRFEFREVPGGDGKRDSLDMNSLSGDNIESCELVEMNDGGCWGGTEFENLNDDEVERLEEFISENGAWALEDEGNWYMDDAEVWVWGPLEVTDENGNSRIIIADEDGNIIDFKDE